MFLRIIHLDVQVKEVQVTARAMLPSTSVISFTLGVRPLFCALPNGTCQLCLTYTHGWSLEAIMCQD